MNTGHLRFLTFGFVCILLASLTCQAGRYPAAVGADALVLSGTLEARQTRIAPEVSERVVEVRAAKGDAVHSGDLLLLLDDAAIKTTIAQAESALRVAQANLDQVNESARPGAVALARAGLAQAQADLDGARRASADAGRALANPQELIAQVHAWEAKVQTAQGAIGQAEAAIASYQNQSEQMARDQSALGKYTLASLQKQKEGAEASLRAAQADLAGSQRILDLYRQMVNQPLELVANQHAAANQVTVAEAGLAVAQAELDIVLRDAQPEAVALAEAKLKAAQSNLDLVRQQAKRYAITSPLDGTVIERNVEPGEAVRPGVAVLTIADVTELEMTCYVPIRDLKSVRTGQAATIRLPSLPGKTFPATIAFVSPEGEFKPANLYNSQDRAEMVFSVRLTIPNPNGELKPGLPGDATLN